MQRRIRFGVGLAGVILALAVMLLTDDSSAAQSMRYRRQPVTETTATYTVSGGANSTSFQGEDSRGERVTVLFPPRFATVERDGARVPVSRLHPGDQVEVRGELRGRRFFASWARLVQARDGKRGLVRRNLPPPPPDGGCCT